MAFDFLDDVFLLYLAFETTQGILKRFTFLNPDLCQTRYTPTLVRLDCVVIARFQAQVKPYVPIFLLRNQISGEV